MCRFILYHGPPLRLSALVTEPQHSLIHQSHRSRERSEPLNGDGFGLAWYAPHLTQRAARFRSITPAWNDANLHELAPVVESHLILAHVRAATGSLSVALNNCHPFTHGPYALVHNGFVGGFARVRRPLLHELSEQAFAAIGGQTDTEHAFALLLDELPLDRPASVDELSAGVRSAIERLLELVRTHAPGEPCSLNFALSDGRSCVATRFTTQPDHDGESLYLQRGREFVCADGACHMLDPEVGGGAVLVSSEPLTDGASWEGVPPNHLLAIDEQRRVRLEPL